MGLHTQNPLTFPHGRNFEGTVVPCNPAPVLSGELMRLALDNLADSVTIHDATGKLLYANEATARMMGMELDEILSAPAGAWTQRFTMYDEYGDELPLERLPGRRVFSGESPRAAAASQRERRGRQLVLGAHQGRPAAGRGGPGHSPR